MITSLNQELEIISKKGMTNHVTYANYLSSKAQEKFWKQTDIATAVHTWMTQGFNSSTDDMKYVGELDGRLTSVPKSKSTWEQGLTLILQRPEVKKTIKLAEVGLWGLEILVQSEQKILL